MPSTTNSVGDLVEIVPHKPNQSPFKNQATTKSELVVDFEHLIGEMDGGSPITSYIIYWDQGESINNFV
jgi:hypothetical protein